MNKSKINQDLIGRQAVIYSGDESPVSALIIGVRQAYSVDFEYIGRILIDEYNFWELNEKLCFEYNPTKVVKKEFKHKKRGIKEKEWNRIREKLKKIFLKKGIIECEIGIDQDKCWKRGGLGFAHRHRRPYYYGNLKPYLGSFNQVILGCPYCHTIIDKPENEPLKEVIFEDLRGSDMTFFEEDDSNE